MVRRGKRERHDSGPWPATRAAGGTVPGFLAAVVLASCGVVGSPTLEMGDPAPAFTATDLASDEPVAVSDYRGHVLLVNLWATWCHPCLLEMPYLQKMYEKYSDRGLRILGVSVDLPADKDRVVEIVADLGVAYDVALDPDSRSTEAFRARGLPTSVLVDREGSLYSAGSARLRKVIPPSRRGS